MYSCRSLVGCDAV